MKGIGQRTGGCGRLNRTHHDYSLLVTLKADGSVEKIVAGSVAEPCILDSADEAKYSRLWEIFRKDCMQIVSFTITKKGYKKTTL